MQHSLNLNFSKNPLGTHIEGEGEGASDNSTNQGELGGVTEKTANDIIRGTNGKLMYDIKTTACGSIIFSVKNKDI